MKYLVIFCFLLCYAEAYKLLVVYPLPVKSLSILGQGVVRHLLNDGHEVTYITTHPLDKPESKTFRQIDISTNYIFGGDNYDIKWILDNQIVENDLQGTQQFGRDNARQTFENENVVKFLQNTNESFDGVIVDLFESEVYTGLAVLYNCPMIWVYSLGAHWQVIRLIGDPANPAYDPDYLGFNIPPFSFVRRVEELWARIKCYYYKTFVTLPIERAIYQKTFEPLFAKRGRVLPNYDEVIFNTSLIFGNEHNAISHRPSSPQNFKYIGGFHIDDPVKPLPKDLQDLLDNAPHGVIYFSMGSFWKSKSLPMKLTKEILKVFGELKETVLWKYEADLEGLPKNVHIVRWAPQQSILAHPNCKFFISHGGLLSSIESIHFGVPVIGIPVLFDQFTNIKKAVANGYAIKVDLNYDLPENLKAAINKMVSDNTYKKKAKELSSIYHDRPVKPGAELAHWVRHVVRTRGAAHLRSPALHVPLYQRLYLDFLGLILAVLFVLYKCLNVLKRRKFVKTKTQ